MWELVIHGNGRAEQVTHERPFRSVPSHSAHFRRRIARFHIGILAYFCRKQCFVCVTQKREAPVIHNANGIHCLAHLLYPLPSAASNMAVFA